MSTNANSMKVERSDRLVSPKARASYPTLFKARAFNETAEPKFSVTLMVKKDAAGNKFIEQVEAIREQALSKLYPKTRAKNLEIWGVTDGDENEDPAMHGNWLVKASSKSRPAVVDASKAEILDEETVYGGCYIRASICAKAYGTPSKGGVTLELVAVQKLEDGEPFSAAERAKSEAVNEFDDDM